MLRSAVSAFAILLVTATVTFGGEYAVVITNVKTNQHGIFQRRFPDQNRCDAAIRGLSERLASLADVDPNDLSTIKEAPNADPDIAQAVDLLFVQIMMNTGALPRLSLSCELLGDPA